MKTIRLPGGLFGFGKASGGVLSKNINGKTPDVIY